MKGLPAADPVIHPGPPRDPRAAHQIVILHQAHTHLLAVSCTCLVRACSPPLERRLRWEAAEALALWRLHLAAGDGSS